MLQFEWHLPVNTNNSSIIELLSTQCAQTDTLLSINQLKNAILQGALWLTRGSKTVRIRKIKKPLNINDTLHFYYNSQILAEQPTAAKLIADQGDYSIWFKPYGMLSQGSKWSDHCTIARWVETHLTPQRPAFVVHRLDKAASGLIIIAHNKRANQTFAKLFTERTLEKRYHILVHGQLNSKELSTGQQVSTAIDDKPALSIFYQKAYHKLANISLMEVKIATGRKHQIRRHAASIGLPVVGDRLYGKKDKDYQDINLQLCAVNLRFNCPLSGQVQEFLLPQSLRPDLETIAAKIIDYQLNG